MRSPAEGARRNTQAGVGLLWFASVCLSGSAHADTESSAASAASAPPSALIATAAAASAASTVDQVRGIVAGLRGEPEFLNRHTERTLRWIVKPASQAPPTDTPSWLVELVRCISNAARGLVWLIGAILAAIVVVSALRWARIRGEAARSREALLPSHVGELDIRPESLPDDVAAVARALLARGEQRAALSLLYRGALSRLVHDHGVEIVGSSTEGECVALAAAALPAASSAWFTRLVQAWQTEVYAGRSAGAAAILALCDQFDAHTLPSSTPSSPSPRPTAESA